MAQVTPPQKQGRFPDCLRILLGYGVMIGSIVLLVWVAVLWRSAWFLGVLLFVFGIPLVPAIQTLLLKRASATVSSFIKVYLVELTSFGLLLAALTVGMAAMLPRIVAIPATVALIAMPILWIIVGLQHLGVPIGDTMTANDIRIMSRVTLGLIGATGALFFVKRWIKKHEQAYFDFWGKHLARLRQIIEPDTPQE